MEKYNERVRALAEKMAKIHSIYLWAKIDEETRKSEIDNMLPLARIAVADEAEAVKKLTYTDIENMQNYLISQGYLPQNDGE